MDTPSSIPRGLPRAPVLAHLVLLRLDPRWQQRIERVAARASVAVLACHSLPRAEHLLRVSSSHGLVLVPDDAGEETLRRLRRSRPGLAMFVAADALSSDARASLLRRGVAEILDQHMGEAELEARLARSVQPSRDGDQDSCSLGNLHMDMFRGVVTWRDEAVALSPRERDVLLVLAQEEGGVLRRDVIHRRVWGYPMAAGSRTVDVNVKRLREKLASATNGRVQVETVSGVGYRLEVA